VSKLNFNFGRALTKNLLIIPKLLSLYEKTGIVFCCWVYKITVVTLLLIKSTAQILISFLLIRRVLPVLAALSIGYIHQHIPVWSLLGITKRTSHTPYY
jgi:hypothetical protein